MHRQFRFALALSAVVLLQTCAPAVAIAIAPQTVTVESGQSVTFSASVTGAADTTVTWSVQEADGGSITGGGVYTAPATPGTFHVIAANGSARATATVTVTDAQQLTISPDTASLIAGGTQQFNATLDNSAPSVSWAVTEVGGGTVNATGLYTAPATPGTYHLVATLAGNAAVTGTATITVTRAAYATVTLSPTGGPLLGGDTVNLTATVTGATNTSVTFAVVEANGGSINATGPTTATYTAPFNAGIFRVTATSVEDNLAAAVATFTVSARPVTVSLSPPNANVVPSGTQQFTAVVSGTANPAVTWSVSGGGSINSAGLYTAPATAGANVTITATSVADTTGIGTALVSVLNPSGNTVTGTVAYTGARTGRIYITVSSATQGTLGGTSLAAPGTFTLRGIQANGQVTVRAWRDALGSATFNRPMDPLGSATLTLPQTATPLTVTMNDPTAATPTRPAQPPYVVGTAGAAAVFYSAVTSAVTGEETADHYRLYWSTTASPGPSNMAGMKQIKAGGNGFAMLFDASFSTGAYFFSTSSVVNGVESAVNATTTAVTFAAPPNGSTISGTVTGFASADPLMILALGVAGNAYRISAVKLDNPTAAQAFTLSNVAAGDYTLYAWIDSGNNGDWDPTDVGNFGTTQPNLAVNGGAGQTLTANVTFSTDDAIATPVTQHSRFFGAESYAVEHVISSNRKQVVAVAIDSGPNLGGVLDVAMVSNATHGATVDTASTAPTTGSNYTYTVTFADASTATLTRPVSAVLSGLPTPLSPTSTANLSPTFTWSAPNPLPVQQPHQYALYLYDQNSQFSGYAVGLPAATTSLPYSQLSDAAPSLTAGLVYYWYLYATDADGNRAASAAYFVAQ